MASYPDSIVHYSRSEPFRSITSYKESDWPRVVSELNENNSWGLARFQDAEYLQRRLSVEQRLHAAFTAKGGRPKIRNPFYLFLGRNLQFESNPKNRGYVIHLKDLPPDVVTFTYGDSLLSWDAHYRSLLGVKYENSLCAEIFGFSELPLLFEKQPSEDPLHVEVQLWMSPSESIIHRLIS